MKPLNLNIDHWWNNLTELPNETIKRLEIRVATKLFNQTLKDFNASEFFEEFDEEERRDWWTLQQTIKLTS